jgi:hypothetical protein
MMYVPFGSVTTIEEEVDVDVPAAAVELEISTYHAVPVGSPISEI